MKKIIPAMILLLFVTSKINAQANIPKPTWVVIKSANLLCWECREKLDNYLFEENRQNMDNGMLKWTFNLLAGEIKVQYLPDRVSIEEIKTAINNAGFDADTTKAEPYAYAKLPPACKYVSEGGGPKKGHPCHLPPN